VLLRVTHCRPERSDPDNLDALRGEVEGDTEVAEGTNDLL
jgi:hypothetical protein